MFYLGVYLEEEEGAAQLAIVEKSFFRGDRRYRMAHWVHLHERDEAALIKRVLDMHRDERWTTVKKAFSQNGRPLKIKREPPLILLSAWNDEIHLAETLRQGRASVEGVLSREGAGQGEGTYYHTHGVTAEMVHLSFAATLSKRGLDPLTLPPSLVSQVGELTSGEGTLLGSSEPWFFAVGSCLWHGEFVRRIKRY